MTGDGVEAAAALRDGWGEAGRFERLPGDVDINFRVTTADGARSILKFVEPDTPDAELGFQHAALAHLAVRHRSAGLPSASIPEVVASREGEIFRTSEGHRVRRLSWVAGPTMATAIPARILPSAGADRFFRSIGIFMGRLDAALADFSHPAAARPHRWDPFQGGWVAGQLDVVGEPTRRAILERVVEAFEARVEPTADTLPRAVIHADGNDHNLIVAADDPWAGPVGVIDFGDMLETARICEPAVAAAYAAMRSNDPVGTVAEVTAGWAAEIARGGKPVTCEELDVVASLVRMRLAISVTVSAGRVAERPDDPYVTVSEAPAWTLLEALDRVSDAEVTARVRRACGLDAKGPPSPSIAGAPEPDAHLTTRRRARTGTNLSLSYAEPIHAVRGWMQWLYDAEGRAWLDVYNNVPHVGHSHPHVAAATARQTSLLATNTRYLSQLRLDYMDRLAALLPDPLDTVFLVNSASEANELALRIVRAATRRRDIIVQEAGYHGHTTTLIDVSPYKADGPGGEGTPEWVHTAAIPDPYRGRWRAGADDDPGGRYAADVAALVERLVAERRPPGALLAETFPSVGGQIVPPAGYLAGAYAAVRAAGGLVVADEVQTGLGRLGSAMWAFETDAVVPDLVVLGKPIGNGFPLAAVVTTRALAEAFDTGMEFFSTFGGNPVACAAGAAVLDVVQSEGLAENAARVGSRLRSGLSGLAERHQGMGDVRGMGLFIGVEMVSDREARTPDAAAARAVVEGLHHRGVLAGTDGPDHNVVKLRGPLVLTEEDADRVVAAVAEILGGT